MSRAIQPTLSFSSSWFVAAMGLAVLVIFLGSLIRLSGTLSLLDPMVVHNKWLHLSEWEFRQHALYFAGEDFDRNVRLVNRKARGVTAMTVLFFAELLCLFVWIGRAL